MDPGTQGYIKVKEIASGKNRESGVTAILPDSPQQVAAASLAAC